MSETEETDKNVDTTARESGSWYGRKKVLAIGSALGGMIVGALVGIAVQVGVESTGVLGPSIDELMSEQQENFDHVRTRLDDLIRGAGDGETRQGLQELAALLDRQAELNERARSEMTWLGDEVSTLKAQALEKNGVAGGADFWLKAGESVNVGAANRVFGLVRVIGSTIDVNLNGEKSRLKVGDTVSVPLDDGECTVFYKQGQPRADRRVGFDIDCI